MTPFWIGTSWKMNKTLPEALAFAEGLRAAAPLRGIQRFVVPPFTACSSVRLGRSNCTITMHWLISASSISLCATMGC